MSLHAVNDTPSLAVFYALSFAVVKCMAIEIHNVGYFQEGNKVMVTLVEAR